MMTTRAIQHRHFPNGGISEALDVLHWVMRPALYRYICMVIEIASTLPAFFVVVNIDHSHNHR